MHIKFILDILIILMKDDSAPYYNLMRHYRNTISSHKKRELFEYVKMNKDVMKDLIYIIKENIIHRFVAKGNLNKIDDIMGDIDS